MNAWLMVGTVALLGLAGCDDRMGDYPSLLPTDQVLAEPALPAGAQDPTAGLGGRRASAPRAAPTDSADLSRRAEALRARADALSRASLDEGCTPGTPDCPESQQPE